MSSITVRTTILRPGNQLYKNIGLFVGILLFFIIMRTRLASELWPLIALLCLASLCCNLLLLTLDEYNYTIWYISRGIEVSSKLFVVSFLIYNIFQELQLSSKLAVHDVLTNIYNRRYFSTA